MDPKDQAQTAPAGATKEPKKSAAAEAGARAGEQAAQKIVQGLEPVLQEILAQLQRNGSGVGYGAPVLQSEAPPPEFLHGLPDLLFEMERQEVVLIVSSPVGILRGTILRVGADAIEFEPEQKGRGRECISRSAILAWSKAPVRPAPAEP